MYFFGIGMRALGFIGVRISEMVYFGGMSPDPLRLRGTLFLFTKESNYF